MTNKNLFTKKLLFKSNQELQGILERKHYVEDAKLAAKWILEDRGEQTNYLPPPKPTKKEHKPWILGKTLDPIKLNYWWRLLPFGVTCIIVPLYFNFQNLITTKNSLTEIKGKIRNSEVIVANVSSRSRLGYKTKSRKATLYFSLNEHQKLFKLVENIGQDYLHDEYNQISKLLNKSNSVVVWINQNELESNQPKVFQVDVNERTM
ncbi:hypothetical protein [Echinicola vietnamensis]|uniref:Uncharacterized protein n=1 Tax=Echinicola vietnamensis (strain DSM 17526 / LMG 23754 / KMM 6221) TaxID=926556 RepID=L0G1T9_ECHVK|nr:hypothetical protein [Echinicola vietnamensis]AGA79487.1 hypothetical protein Echvi_3261 [Echinicola vietnamensis DSM 17526]